MSRVAKLKKGINDGRDMSGRDMSGRGFIRTPFFDERGEEEV